MGRFTNKIVAITGGTSGIGIAAARQFISDDASYIRGAEFAVAAVLNSNRRHQGGAPTLRKGSVPHCLSASRRCRILARCVTYCGAAIRSLSSGKRTSSGHRESVAGDPQATWLTKNCCSANLTLNPIPLLAVF